MQPGRWPSQLGRSRPGASRGFTYVWALVLVALMSIGLAVIGPRWADAAQREREQELLRVGMIYAQAIRSYHRASPGSVKQFPPSLEALLEDTRHVGTYRHLRSLYPDPIDPSRPWGLVRDATGGILGVHSTSAKVPLRRAALELDGGVQLAAAGSYQQWIFAPRIEASAP